MAENREKKVLPSEIEALANFYFLFSLIGFTLDGLKNMLNTDDLEDSELVFEIDLIKNQVVEWMNLLLDLHPNLELIDLDSFNPKQFDYSSISLTKSGNFNYLVSFNNFQLLRDALVDVKSLLIEESLSPELLLIYVDILDSNIERANELIKIAKEQTEFEGSTIEDNRVS